MVGLSVVLESQNGSTNHNNNNKNNPQVINKATMIINNNNNNKNKLFSSSSSSSSSSSTSKRVSQSTSFPVLPFLEHCFLCRQKLLPGKDIYLYKGDMAFCSVECRCRQITMDDEESLSTKEKCSLAAMKPASASAASSSSSSSSSSPSGSRHRNKGARNRTGGFAY